MTNIFVPLLTLSRPRVIRPKTRRPAGENYVHIYKFNKLSTLCMSTSSRWTLVYPYRKEWNEATTNYNLEEPRNIEQQPLVNWSYS